MFGTHLAIAVDEAGALAAREHFALLLREELVAVGAFVQVILFFLQEKLQLLHEKATDNLVFALLQHIEAV